jgi:hypothetical protein
MARLQDSPEDGAESDRDVYFTGRAEPGNVFGIESDAIGVERIDTDPGSEPEIRAAE